MKRMKENRFLQSVALAALMFAGGNSVAADASIDDATVLAIVDQSDTADILLGRLAAKQGGSEEVRKLGKMLALEHESVQQMGRELAKRLDVVPSLPKDDTSISKLADTIATLQSKSGAEFDAAYLPYEIKFHQAVIDTVNKNLLPAVKNEELRAHLQKTLPGLERHLNEVRSAAQKLGINS